MYGGEPGCVMMSEGVSCCVIMCCGESGCITWSHGVPQGVAYLTEAGKVHAVVHISVYLYVR